MNSHGPVDVLEVRDVAAPDLPSDGVVVEVLATSINPGEAKIRTGMPGADDRFPMGQGSDLAGRVVAVREPSLSTWPEGPLQATQLPRGLGLRPVRAKVAGPCPPTSSPNVVWGSLYDTCYTLGSEGMQVTGVRSAQVLHEQDGVGSWSVRLRFDDAQTAAYTRLTDTLVDEPAPRDELAIILDGPPGGLVLAAPLVERGRPLTYLDLDGGSTEASARALLQSLLR